MKVAEHISDENILLFLDGEVKPSAAAQVKEHLEACWTCRARRDEIQGVINGVVEHTRHDDAMSEFLPRPDGQRAMFISRLDQMAEQRPPRFRFLWGLR